MQQAQQRTARARRARAPSAAPAAARRPSAAARRPSRALTRLAARLSASRPPRLVGGHARARRGDALEQLVQRGERARCGLQEVPQLLQREPARALLRLQLRHDDQVLLEALADGAGEGVHDEARGELRRLGVRPLPQLQVLRAW